MTGSGAGGYPRAPVEAGHVERCGRRVRGLLGGEVVFDTTAAIYVWEWPNYPQYYVPLADVRDGLLVKQGDARRTKLGAMEQHDLRAGGEERPHAARVFVDSDVELVSGTVRFEWSALDAWFEEDERVVVHPRNPYTRVDAVRSSRGVRIELEGVVLAESDSSVMVFETGLPTRHYLDRTALRLEHLVPSGTATACPYKGTTSAYWSARVGDELHQDIAWSYDFPTRELLPIAGLVAFYDERVDTFVDGAPLERPRTHFFSG